MAPCFPWVPLQGTAGWPGQEAAAARCRLPALAARLRACLGVLEGGPVVAPVPPVS